MTSELQDNVADTMVRDIAESNLLKYAAGRAMFCPHCNQIMDWRRTVVATVHAGERCIQSYVVCATCFDKRRHILEQGIAKANKSLEAKGSDKRGRLEIVDGRDSRFDNLD